MNSRFRKIPSPNGLILFEASARHLSFTKAAFELNLSQAAVSKQVANLEERLNMPLFVRSHRTIALTEKGKILYEGVTKGFGHILGAVELMHAPAASRIVTISATTVFAQMWLLPRLAKFKQNHPEVDLRLLTSDDHLGPVDRGVDIAIKYGDDSWHDVFSTYLVSCEVFPVCSPGLLKECSVESLEELEQIPLIDLDSDNWQWIHWKDWLLQHNIRLKEQHVCFEFNNIPMLYRAAEEGQGMALGWGLFVKELIVTGRLVAPFKERIKLPEPWGYYLLLPRSCEISDEIQKVKKWIIDEAKKER